MTPRESDSPQRNGRSVEILEAARGLFAEKGFDGTSISDIAGRVGVADGAIYRHFSSKRAILFEVIRGFYEPVIDVAAATVSGISDIESRLRYLVWLQLRAFVEEPEVCRFIISEARPMADYYETEIADLNRRWTSLMVEVIKEGQRSGTFRSDLPATMVRDVVYGGIEHIAWGAATGHGAIDVETVADNLTELVCVGLEPRAEKVHPSAALDARVSRIEELLDKAQP